MKTRNIPYLSFNGMHDDIEQELIEACSKVIKSKWYILGNEVTDFENEFGKYINSKFNVGVANGLDALIISLKCLDIGPGDEVIVASNAYIACWNAIHAVGATIVPVEPDPQTFNLDPSLIVSSITKNTKAIMAVHLFGLVCDMDAILKIAEEYGLFIIEDNAQAQGAQIKTKKSASIGHINATSFYPGKNLGALGDGGMISTDNQQWAKKSLSLRNYGSGEKYINEYIGMNSRLDEMQAAILSVKLNHLDRWNQERIQIAKWYDQYLTNNSSLKKPKLITNGSHVYHVYSILSSQRNQIQEALKLNGIQTLIHYPIPPHLQQAYAHLEYKEGDFLIAEELADKCLSLPIYPGLSKGDVKYIANKIVALTN